MSQFADGGVVLHIPDGYLHIPDRYAQDDPQT